MAKKKLRYSKNIGDWTIRSQASYEEEGSET